ncbi:hypothetical protein CG740_31770 [Streptomyces sp. CB01201]|uniref:hypothetical protein n=1 Tax=Streptomyces sp. CB01201 TaxID=2020324 RepID=UPI000C279B05|nr:hypothetical protein [Streptomyces sp. CB01201]PJM99199.1 hypothetical protein CG740_31770 [Streptomyces sp. CB01201]
MNRRILPPAATALAATAALVLTACSSNDAKSQSSDKIAGANQNSGSSATPRALASASAPSTDRPKIELPSDLSYTFDWPKNGDTAQSAVLSDAEQFIKAIDYAIVKQDPLQEAYRFYSEGELAASTQAYVQEYVKAKSRVTGSSRYYNATPLVSDHGTASLSYCQDQSKAYDMAILTGKVDKTPATKNSYVLYNTALRKNDRGIWITTKMLSTRGSSKCQP